MASPERRKILFVIDSFNIGGAERSLCTLLNLLPQNRFDLRVLLTARGGALEKYLPAGIALSEIPLRGPGLRVRIAFAWRHALHAVVSRLPGPLRSKANPVERHWRLLGSLAPAPEENFDVAVAYHQGFPTYYVARKIRADRKIAWINADIVRDRYTEDFNLGFYSLYNKVVAASPGLRGLLLDSWRFDPARVIAVRDIVSPAVLQKLAAEESCPKENGEEAAMSVTGSSPLVILTVGRLVPVKGYDLLLGAACLLRDRGLNFRWDIVGDGPLRKQIEEEIGAKGLREHVRLLGALDNPYPLMRRCDIYVQPSRSEGYGIAVCEAQAFCRPVIITDFKVASGLVDDGTDGLICGMTAGALADAVMRLSSPQLREQFSAHLATNPPDNATESLDIILDLLS